MEDSPGVVSVFFCLPSDSTVEFSWLEDDSGLHRFTEEERLLCMIWMRKRSFRPQTSCFQRNLLLLCPIFTRFWHREDACTGRARYPCSEGITACLINKISQIAQSIKMLCLSQAVSESSPHLYVISSNKRSSQNLSQMNGHLFQCFLMNLKLAMQWQSLCPLSANKDQVMDQLKLALAWNRIDIAKSEIFTDERPWPVSGCPFALKDLNLCYNMMLCPKKGVSFMNHF